MSDAELTPVEELRRICNNCNREFREPGRCECGNPEYRIYVDLLYADKVAAENQRLKEYAQLVETAIEAEECNGKTHDHWTAITLNSSWFKKARALLEERER